MSLLRSYATKPPSSLNTSLMLYKSFKFISIIVEGKSDRELLESFLGSTQKLRIVDVDGKPNVLDNFNWSLKNPFNTINFSSFIVDLDYDLTTNLSFIKHNKLIYNAYCSTTEKVFFNDLEVFLINTNSLEKTLIHFNIRSLGILSHLRDTLEQLSREIGKLRAADIKTKNNQGNILDGLELVEFLKNDGSSFDIDAIKTRLSTYSPRKYDIDDLFAEAENLNNHYTSAWALSRGHDVTAILSKLISIKESGRHITKEKIEKQLRNYCDIAEYRESPMAKKMLVNGIAI